MSRDPTESPSEANVWWLPITADYKDKIRAGHLFSSRCGRDIMDAIFGVHEQTEWIDLKDKAPRKSELYRPVNGILWSDSVLS